MVDKENVKDKKIAHPWEECRGIGGSFGLNRNESLAEYSTSDELIKVLIEKVSRGGNLLLDIGPAADGTIPVIMQQRLTDMGSWLKVNGEAIYSTQAWNDAPGAINTGIFFTQKGKDLYVLCTHYPANPINIGHVHKPQNVSMLGNTNPVRFNYTAGTLTITPDQSVYRAGRYAWVFKIQNAL